MDLAYTLISHRLWSFVCHNYASLYISKKLIFGTFWFYNLKHIFFVFPCFTGIYLLQVTHFYAIKMRMTTTNDNPKIPGLLHLSLRPDTTTTNGWDVAGPLRDQSSVPKNKGYRLPSLSRAWQAKTFPSPSYNRVPHPHQWSHFPHKWIMKYAIAKSHSVKLNRDTCYWGYNPQMVSQRYFFIFPQRNLNSLIWK